MTIRNSGCCLSRLVTHYWSHGCFLVDGQLLAGLDRLAEIPAVLVHGRYDVSSPLDTAWQLHRNWPASRLVVVDDAGHGGGGFTSAFVGALNSVLDYPRHRGRRAAGMTRTGPRLACI